MDLPERRLIAVRSAVARSPAVKPHPETEYDSKLFDALVGVPWDPQGKHSAEEPEGPVEDARELPRLVVPRNAESEIPQSRRMLITRSMIARFGPTPGCSKCRAIQ